MADMLSLSFWTKLESRLMSSSAPVTKRAPVGVQKSTCGSIIKRCVFIGSSFFISKHINKALLPSQ